MIGDRLLSEIERQKKYLARLPKDFTFPLKPYSHIAYAGSGRVGHRVCGYLSLWVSDLVGAGVQRFGRRIRCLVRDQQNGKVMGLLALTDPVFNLRARDQWIDWKQEDRRERLIHTMDAYVLGALPPYSKLFCGKLVASLVASKELAAIFKNKYRNSETEIRERKVSPRLALVTTTSALGRSSVYNRLKFKDRLLFVPIGMTLGYGHFHFPDRIILRIRSLLRDLGHKYADGHKFGEGPNWRIRVIREGLDQIGLSPEILRHGIKREVFVIPTKEFLKGVHTHAFSNHIPIADLTSFCLNRWIVPRASWDSSYKDFKHAELLEIIRANGRRRKQQLVAA